MCNVGTSKDQNNPRWTRISDPSRLLACGALFLHLLPQGESPSTLGASTFPFCHNACPWAHPGGSLCRAHRWTVGLRRPPPRPPPPTSQSRACCCAAFIKSQALGMSQTVQWLRIHLSAGDGGLIPGRGSESPPATEQLSRSATAEPPKRNQRVWCCEGDPKIPRGSATVPPAATKTQHNQITK